MTRDDQTTNARAASSLRISGSVAPEYAAILTPEALGFVETLVREFTPTRDALLKRRVERQAEIDAGHLPDFLPDTANIRNADWQIAPTPPDL